MTEPQNNIIIVTSSIKCTVIIATIQ